MAYPIPADLAAYLGIGDSDDDILLASAVSSANRAVDDWCRLFPGAFAPTAADDAYARTFLAVDPYCVTIDPLGATATAVVKVDAGNDGTYETTLTAADLVWEPANAVVDGKPVTRVRVATGTLFPVSSYGRPQVQITGQWGWPSTPAPVFQACLQVAAETYNRKDAPFGIAGTTEQFGPIRLSADALKAVTSLLQPYRYAGGVALA